MRKFFVLAVIIAMVFVAFGNAQAKELKIGFADKMKILFEYNKTKKLNEELERESQDARAQVEARTEEIRKMRDEMGLLSDSAKKEKQPELERKMQELNNFRREKMQEIGRKQDEGVRKISKEIADICEQYGKSKGYDAIIDIRATLYTPTSLELTDDILKDLNK